MNLCLTCNSVAGVVSCLTCSSGYAPSTTNSTICVSVCGDGVLVGTEVCDDGNLNTGDGCDNVCLIESAHYCNLTGNLSVCDNCSLYCLNCTSPISCTLCQTNTTWNITSALC